MLRRIYTAPELFQLLATFAVVLVIKDVALFAWGAEDLVGPRAPGLSMAVEILGKRIPAYDLLLIAIGPVVLRRMWLLLTRTRWGALVRAATQDREMVGALGVDQAKLFTSVFFVGSVLAGLGGALQIPREPANLDLDLAVIADAFVVTVVGGLGSIGGAFLAAILIGVAKAFCIGIGTVHWFGVEIVFSKLTLVVEFLIMARGAGGAALRPARQAAGRAARSRPMPAPPLHRAVAGPFALVWLALLLVVPLLADRYVTVLLTDIVCFALFAVSLHFIMGPAGMVSFGHAAYFGLGAYAAGAAAEARRPADGSGARAGAARRRRLRRGLWLVLRAAVGRLSRHADAGLRADQLVDRLPVGFAHRRQQRPVRRLAVGLARRQDRLLLPGARPLRRRHRAAVARAVLALRLRAARRPRFAAARRGDRHRPARAIQWAAFVLAGALAGLAGARLRLLQGQHLALGDLHRAVDRRAGHGAAGRRRDADRPGRRARRSSPGCATRSPAAPNSGAPCMGGW